MHLSNTGSITKRITKFTSPGSTVTVQVTTCMKEMKMNESYRHVDDTHGTFFNYINIIIIIIIIVKSFILIVNQ